MRILTAVILILCTVLNVDISPASLMRSAESASCDGLEAYADAINTASNAILVGAMTPQDVTTVSSDEWGVAADRLLEFQRALKQISPPGWLADWHTYQIEVVGFFQQFALSAQTLGFLPTAFLLSGSADQLTARGASIEEAAISICPDVESLFREWNGDQDQFMPADATPLSATPAPTPPVESTSTQALAPTPNTAPLVNLDQFDLAGRSVDQVRSQLIQLGFDVVVAEEASITVGVGNVIRIEPKHQARLGETVTVFVSVGDQIYIYPELQGLPLREVEALLNRNGLKVIGAIGVSAAVIEAAGLSLEEGGIEDGDVVGIQDNGANFGAWLPRGTEITLVYFDESSD